jgi:hypothetical protein
MKRLVLIIISFNILLSSCSSVLNTFIPDQALENPFRLNDRSLTLTTTVPEDIFAKVTSVLYRGNLSNSSPNLDPSVLGPTRPTGITENLTFASTVNLSSQFANNSSDPKLNFPQTLTATSMKLMFEAVDGPAGLSFSKDLEPVYQGDLVLTRGQCLTNPINTNCTYSLNTDQTLFELQFLGDEFNTLFEFLTTGGEPNTIGGTLELEFTGEAFPPLDTQMTVILKTSEGTLRF